MLSDDLSSLFANPAAGAAVNAQFRQGVIASFSKVDGSNSVVVGTTVIPNVPMLLTGAEINYVAGDPVILMVMGNTYMLLGKVAMVGSSQFASTTLATASARNTALGGGLSTTAHSVLTSATVTVPSWANHVSLLVCGVTCYFNNFGADTDVFIQVSANGDVSSFIDGYSHAASWEGQTMVYSSDQTVSPGAVLTCSTLGWCNGGFSGQAGTVASVFIQATFTKQ